MRVVTWNVNSVRLRLEQMRAVDAALRPDLLCLQEIKVADPLFPADAFSALGYVHQAISGMKSYNGVAILSRHPLSDIRGPQWCGRDDHRHLVAQVHEPDRPPLEVHCLYVPAGGDVPDPEVNDKFAHKLAFLDNLSAWFAAQPTDYPRMLLGDLNIAPLESDVWSHRQMLKVVSHTPVEVARLRQMQDSGAWIDAMRQMIPEPERLYTWWSYRSPDWSKSDRGRRLDHAWISPPLLSRLTAVRIFRDSRSWSPPSDHVPVMVELD